MSDGSGPVLPTLTFQRKLTLYHGGRVFELLELCESGFSAHQIYSRRSAAKSRLSREFAPIIRRAYDEATEELELFQ
jgi:hypothetical protein